MSQPAPTTSSAEAEDAPLDRPRVPRRLPAFVPGMRPDFLLIGAQKCGTSSLYRYLAAHPDVAWSVPKEVHFFNRHWSRGLRFYESHFPTRLWARARALQRGRRPLAAEGTPQYFYHFRSPERIRRTLPDARFVLLLRNPVDRAWSHYQMAMRKDRAGDGFAAAVAGQLERLEGLAEVDLRAEWKANFSEGDKPYLAKGLYADALAHWWTHFERERFLILHSDDLFREPEATYAEVLRFLGLPAWRPAAFGRYNAGAYAPLDPALRRRLLDFFRPHNERLFELIGRRFDWDR